MATKTEKTIADSIPLYDTNKMQTILKTLLNKGCSVIFNSNTGSHAFELGIPYQIDKVTLQSNNILQITAHQISAPDRNGLYNVNPSDFKILGIHRGALDNAIDGLQTQLTTLKGLQERLDDLGLSDSNSYFDLRKEIIRNILDRSEQGDIDKETKLKLIVELTDAFVM